MALESFNAYHSYLTAIEPLNDAERGRLFTALLTYSSTGEVPDLRGNERFVFPQMKWQIDRDKGSYNDFCARQSENGKKGGRPKKPSVNSETQKTQAFFEKPKKANNKDKEKDKDKDKDKDRCFPSDEEKHKGASALDAALNDFAEMRKKMRKPLTDRALALTLSELEKLAPGNDEKKIAILNQSIQRGWQGVFPLKDEPEAPKKTAPARMPHGDDRDRLERILANLENKPNEKE